MRQSTLHYAGLYALLHSCILLGCSVQEEHEQPAIGPIDLGQIMRSDWRPGINEEGNVLVTGIRSEQFGIGVNDSLQLYYYDGKLKQVMRIANGRRNGVHVEFNDDGSLYFTGNVLNGRGEGVYKSYDEQGKLESVSLLYDGTTILDYPKRSLDSLLILRNK